MRYPGIKLACWILCIAAFAELLPGQVLVTSIDCGSATDSGFVGGTAYQDASMGAGALSTLRYGQRFSYRIPTPPGLYLVRFLFVEPNQTLPLKRLFKITVNGQDSPAIDLVASAGPKPAGYLVVTSAISYWGQIVIDFTGIIGNAVVNGIEIQPVGGQTVAQSYECIQGTAFIPAPGITAPNCTGIRVAVFTKPDGSQTVPYFIIPAPSGLPIPPVTDLATWRAAPIP